MLSPRRSHENTVAALKSPDEDLKQRDMKKRDLFCDLPCDRVALA